MFIKVMSNQLTSVLFSLNLAITLFNKQHINTFVWITDSSLHSKGSFKDGTDCSPTSWLRPSLNVWLRPSARVTDTGQNPAANVRTNHPEMKTRKSKRSGNSSLMCQTWNHQAFSNLARSSSSTEFSTSSLCLFTLARGLRRDVRVEPTARASRLLQICDTHGPFKQWLGGLMI